MAVGYSAMRKAAAVLVLMAICGITETGCATVEHVFKEIIGVDFAKLRERLRQFKFDKDWDVTPDWAISLEDIEKFTEQCNPHNWIVEFRDNFKTTEWKFLHPEEMPKGFKIVATEGEALVTSFTGYGHKLTTDAETSPRMSSLMADWRKKCRNDWVDEISRIGFTANLDVRSDFELTKDASTWLKNISPANLRVTIFPTYAPNSFLSMTLSSDGAGSLMVYISMTKSGKAEIEITN